MSAFSSEVRFRNLCFTSRAEDGELPNPAKGRSPIQDLLHLEITEGVSLKYNVVPEAMRSEG
jgi:hypothetical protein